MKATLRGLGVGALIVLAFISFAVRVPAADRSVTDAIEWLEAAQDGTGLWGVEKRTPFRDATVVVEALQKQGGDSSVIAGGLDAILGMDVRSNDYRARRVLVLAACEAGIAATGYADGLAEQQNTDGGWGFSEGYGSSTLETALVLRALRRAGISHPTEVGSGVGYLTASQNVDGGWGFTAEDSSRVFYTAHVIQALAQFAGDLDVAAPIQDGGDWLKSQAHPDGGLGTGESSNPYETGLAMAAIIMADPLASEAVDARAHLEGTQLPDGSWDSDAYGTAMALHGLSSLAPDLSVGSSDVVFSNPNPSDNEVVTISATIHNRGAQMAEGVIVRFYDGAPELGGEQIGDDLVIPSLDPGSEVVKDADWDTHSSAGDHDLYVLVDPDNQILESNEFNNTAVKPIHVYFPPDLILASIEFEPLYPDSTDTVITKITVENVGELTATSVSLQVWDGDYHWGGIRLLNPPYVIGSIGPGGQFTLNVDMGNYFDSPGEYLICACADVDDTIREVNEENNCGCETLWVGYRCEPVALDVGLNLLGLPLEPTTALTAFSLIEEILACREIDGWDRVLQRWKTTVDTGDGRILGEDFAIETRDGFFVRVTEAVEASLCGSSVEEHGSTSLSTGFNAVSIPNEDACYTAYSMIDDIEGCTEARSWDSAGQTWITTEKIGEDQFIGEDFDIVRGHGYVAMLQQDTEWTTSICDTIPILPDLLVTPDDIFLDPNPVQAGSPVGIYVNINNIGLETAYSPRLDIFEGDPDAGGTHLLGGNLPVDIEPGGSSGFYGNEFVFTAPGSYDIYGVADYYDAIEELDETNNRAYRTLEVTPAVLLAKIDVSGGGDRPAEPAVEVRIEGERALLPLHVPQPVTPAIAHVERTGDRSRNHSHSEATLPENRSEVRGSLTDAKGQPAVPITMISDVSAGNHTSSSITITWVTDGIADGCVNYGPTTALGYSECEGGSGSDVHMVTIAGLSEQSLYYFEVVSDGITDDNDGNYYTFSTPSFGVGVPYGIYGQVVEAGGDSAAAEGVLVSAMIRHGTVDSYRLHGRTDPDGMWVFNLGNLKDPNTGEVLPYDVGDSVYVAFEGGSLGTGDDRHIVSGDSPQDCGIYVLGPTVSVDGDGDLLPVRYYLSDNYPNPFSVETTLKFGLPVAGHVELTIFDILGRRVVVLVDEGLPAGHYLAHWIGRNAIGQEVSSGTYFYRLSSESFHEVGKMFLLR